MKSFLLGVIILFAPVFVFAHPGNTDSSGCHTCRTNCSNWGLSYGEDHCHNAKTSYQPEAPIRSTYGAGGTGTTQYWPDYEYSGSTYSAPSIPSCPLMATYDSLSNSCKCYSGYFSKNGKCVSADSLCKDQLGIMSSYDSLSDKCKCSYGYVLDGGKCTGASTVCRNEMGLMSRYNSLSNKCECMSGYEFNGSSCEYKSTASYYTPNYSTYSAPSTSYASCPANSYESPTDSTKCLCNTGYQLNPDRTACIPSQPTIAAPVAQTASAAQTANDKLIELLKAQLQALLAQLAALKKAKGIQ